MATPVQIEPLTAAEEKDKRKTAAKQATANVEDDPDYPESWKGKDIAKLASEGWKYYRRVQGDVTYMLLRKGKKDKGLGAWDEEKEAKLFTFHPTIETMGGIPKPEPWVKEQWEAPHDEKKADHKGRVEFASIPISRPAIIPRDYVPNLNVIRYFQIVKANGFPGNFSKFINDMVTHHMHDCWGVELPVVFRKDEKELVEEFYGRKETEQENTA